MDEHRTVWGRICSLKHPFLTVLLLGILIRALVGALSIVYDADYWAVVIRNIESGNGLYGLEGYYYTPVWGYILGGIAAFQDAFLNVGESAVRIAEALFTEGSGGYFSATIPSLLVIYSVKIPLFVCDLITSFVVMRLVKEATDDGRKALFAFSLVFISPVLLMSTGVISMPDTVSAMFAVLTVYCLKKRYPLIAGMTFSLAALVKFFPAFMIFVMVGYMASRCRSEGRDPVPDIAMAVVGAAIMTVLVFLPQILAGNLEQCFQFLEDRTGFADGDNLFDTLAGLGRILIYGIILILSALFGCRMSRYSGDDPFRELMRYCLIIAASVLIYPPTTQYIVILVPFLAYWIATSDRRHILSWKILAVGSVIYTMSSFGLALLPLAVWAGFPDVGSALHIFDVWYSPIVAGICPGNIQFAVGGVLQCSAIILVLYGMYMDAVRDGKRLLSCSSKARYRRRCDNP